MSSVQNPGWLFYIGDYMDCTTQLYGNYNKPLQGSLLTNQDDSWKESEVFFCGSFGVDQKSRGWLGMVVANIS